MKNKIQDSLFYAKVLLFGEYGIIEDSMGLSIPYDLFKGQLHTDKPNEVEAKRSNSHLYGFYAHLKGLVDSKVQGLELDLDRMRADLDKGLWFDSSIPEGFGVGSSGAICAAVYDRYGINKKDKEVQPNKKQILELKKIFGEMEAYFHGKSSGLDPLICYLNLPILIKSKSDVDTVGLPMANQDGQGAIFLLSSGTPGQTAPMVSIFMDKLKNEGFRNMMKAQFKKYNDACIHAFLKGDFNPLFDNLRKLSRLALDNFKPMIPDSLHNTWENGLNNESYYLKLCGSGGGGFILGFTKDYEQAKKELKGHDLEVIYKF